MIRELNRNGMRQRGIIFLIMFLVVLISVQTEASTSFTDDNVSISKDSICTPPPADMVSWWKAEDNADDTIGTNHGTSMNGATYASGKVGQAFSFDGVDDYVDLPDGFADFTSGLTIGLWANATPSGKWARFIDLGNGRANNNILFARRTTSNDLAFEVYDGAGNSTGMAYAVDAITNNEWHYYAATLNAAGQVQLYKDGLPLAMGASTTGVPANVTRVSNYIGKSNWEVDGDAYYAGSMDEVVIFNRALTADEIAAIYNAGSGSTCMPKHALTITNIGTGSGTVTKDPEGIVCGDTEAPNIALNKTVTALTNTVMGTPDVVVNGSFSDVWYSWQGGYSTVSFVIDLENEVNINSLRFQFAQTENYTIYSSSDNANWTTRHSGSWNFFDATSPISIPVNGAYSARYIKYLGDNYQNAYVGVLEFEVHTAAACYDQDTVVTLTAMPDAGSIFAGWSGDEDCSDGQVTMDADKACTAEFNIITGPLPDLTGNWEEPLTETCKEKKEGLVCKVKGKFSLRNMGEADAQYVKVRLYLSEDDSLDESDILLKESMKNKVLVGKDYKKSYSLTLPVGMSLQGRYIIVYIDADNTTEESNESNNFVIYGQQE